MGLHYTKTVHITQLVWVYITQKQCTSHNLYGFILHRKHCTSHNLYGFTLRTKTLHFIQHINFGGLHYTYKIALHTTCMGLHYTKKHCTSLNLYGFTLKTLLFTHLVHVYMCATATARVLTTTCSEGTTGPNLSLSPGAHACNQIMTSITCKLHLHTCIILYLYA